MRRQSAATPRLAQTRTPRWLRGSLGGENDDEVGKDTYVEDGENENLLRGMRGGGSEQKGGNQDGRAVWRF